jgi:hypothetical protein
MGLFRHTNVSGALFTGVVVFLQMFLLLLYRSLIIRFFVSLFAGEVPLMFTTTCRAPGL